MRPIGVLIVEAEPLAAEAHAAYVSRLPGFVVAGQARTGAEALRMLAKGQTELVLLDIYLPDMHGLEVVRALRAAGHPADVIVLTKARDLAVVQAAVSYGIVHYLLKPFTFPTVQDKLERYRSYRAQVGGAEAVAAQHEVDRLLATLHGADPVGLPKGISRESFDAVVAVLQTAGGGLSAGEVARVLGASRVTARRYLEYLAGLGVALRQARYRDAGRPEVAYRWHTPRHGDRPVLAL
jgi:response regulator of citrate/malate metabolism